ncbi:GC-rich sequence DNA-binding factor 2-like [Solea senegalensis]|uniref:GC-rich sequence DNA-binding factor 2-like n=1 Tax=Solea senegalensis TaxID=28829 RepID=A0AAV6Q1U8_SOLSE|nr:GC-rich sequence DNA-binding factor 2 isoform X1 [Solea senegalensis]KAG7482388.1 GC-rich sequence DNA-binding factor 2-like [Solea senegalensis]
MFNKKPRRNFRQRKQSSSDDEEQQGSGGDGVEVTIPSTVVNKQFTVTQGRGITCSSKQESTTEKKNKKPANSDEEEIESLIEEEKEYIKKENDAGEKKTSTVLSFSDDREAEESTFKVKKSSDKAVLFQVKKKEASSARTPHSAAPVVVPPSVSPRQDTDSESSPNDLYSDDDDDDDDDNEDDDGNNIDDNDSDEDGAMSPSASSDSSYSTAKKVVIPNAEEILAAKRQRRATRGQHNFIALDRDGRSSAGSTPDHYSKDNDEDEDVLDDDEPDDHERRIEFAPRLKSIRERIAEKMGGSEGSLSGSDEEEQELWEEMQIGKGVKRQQREQSDSESCSSSSSRRDKRRQKKRSVTFPKTLPPISVSMVKKRIRGKLESLSEVHRARQAELRRMEGDVEGATTSVETLSESSSESQLKFYRSMALYVHNLVECLREKVVEINSLELELHSLLSDHMEALLAQRRQEVKEQAEGLQQLSYSTDEQKESSTNGSETQDVGSTTSKAEDNLDLPEDSTPSAEEEKQLQKKMADIVLRSQAVFSDVQNDFCDVKKILSRFEEWRRSYSESYHSAYISLCLPKLLNPIIRHQLLAWNPLKDASGDFENLPWFTALETFCYGHGHEELDHIDRQTLSNVIEKTVLPKITVFVELIWDPLSRQQSVCLSEVCHKLKEDYSIFEGEQSKPVKTFTEAVVRRLKSCVDEDVFIPLYPKKVLEDKLCPQSRFREQQLWMAIKLLDNMCKWDLLLPETSLKELMLDKLLNRYLMITLCSQTLTNSDRTCRRIAESLPLSWFKGVNACLPQLQNFRNHLIQRVHSICKQHSPEDPNTRSAVVELLQVLSRIRCYDSIMTIAEKYHYQDVIYSHQLLNQDPE